jgi:hypothetical protein
MPDLEFTFDDYEKYIYFYEDNLDTLYFVLPNIAKRTGYLKKAKLINDFVLREVICIQGECYNKDVCEECPVENIIHRVI